MTGRGAVTAGRQSVDGELVLSQVAGPQGGRGRTLFPWIPHEARAPFPPSPTYLVAKANVAADQDRHVIGFMGLLTYALHITTPNFARVSAAHTSFTLQKRSPPEY